MMAKIINKNSSICLLIVLLVFSRLIPHPPNFTPIISIVILSGILFKTFRISSFIFLISMFISDLILGLHSGIIFVYLSLLIIGFLSFYIINEINYKNLFVYSFLGSLIFYLITNFAVWVSSNMYEKTFNGLIQCYILAAPFFSNTVISTIFFSYLTFICVNKLNRYFYRKEDDKFSI